jgi:hypothetical protein
MNLVRSIHTYMLALGQSRPEKQNTIKSYVLHLLSEFTRACAGAPVVDVRSSGRERRSGADHPSQSFGR